MRKTVLVSLAVLLVGFVFAQDTAHNTSSSAQYHTKVHKKSRHDSNTTRPVDSVNAGKITTNPHGKQAARSSTMKRKSSKNQIERKNNISTDSTR